MIITNKFKGISLYTTGMLITVLLNITVKFIINKYNIPTVEVLCVRQSILVACLVPFMIKRKFNFFDKRAFKPNLKRNIVFSLGTFLLYAGMARVPLNEATAITFLTPITGSLLAIKFLGEKSSKSLWISLILALIGMFVIKQPTVDNKDLLFGYIFLFFTCAFIRAYNVVLNRELALKFDTITLLFYANIMMFLISLFFFPQFVKFSLDAIKYILIACILFFLEYFFLFKAYKYCNASILQPFEFTKLIFMMFLSYLFLNEHITLNQCIGGVIILSSYCFIFFKKN